MLLKALGAFWNILDSLRATVPHTFLEFRGIPRSLLEFPSALHMNLEHSRFYMLQEISDFPQFS